MLSVILLSVILQSVIIMSVIMLCRYPECHNAGSCYAENVWDECHRDIRLSVTLPRAFMTSVVILGVVVLNVVAPTIAPSGFGLSDGWEWFVFDNLDNLTNLERRERENDNEAPTGDLLRPENLQARAELPGCPAACRPVGPSARLLRSTYFKVETHFKWTY